LEDVSHDGVNDFLRQNRFLPRELWKLVKDRISDSPEAFLIVDDSVHDKRYSRFIELVRAQYSGNEHRGVRGIGVVSLVHSAGKEEDFYPIDYRVYAPDVDGKTKNDHFHEMFVNAVDQKQLRARTMLFDGWYASAENLKLIHRRKWTFFTTLRSNRLVSLSKEQGYIHLEDIEWTPDSLVDGVIVKLKEVPFKVRLFKLVAPEGDIDWVITNDLDETITAQVAEESSDVRWQVDLVFRAWKSGLHVATVTTTTKYSILCYLYGRLLLILLTSALSSPLRVTVWQQHRELSLFKLARYFQASAEHWLQRLFQPPRQLTLFLLRLCATAIRLVRKAVRKRRTSTQRLRESLGSQLDFFEPTLALAA
jgi:hypothetical protein